MRTRYMVMTSVGIACLVAFSLTLAATAHIASKLQNFGGVVREVSNLKVLSATKAVQVVALPRVEVVGRR